MPKKIKTKRKDYSKFIVKIHDNDYMTVAGRIKMFWDRIKAIKGTGSIITKVSQNDNRITIKAIASIEVGGKIIAKTTGSAAEVIGANYINKTSALENCETSAIGRALGNMGIGLLGAGGVASAEEIKRAEMEDTEDTQSDRPSIKQIRYLEQLAQDTGEFIPDILDEEFTKAKASDLINKLRKIQKEQHEKNSPDSDEVNVGEIPF